MNIVLAPGEKILKEWAYGTVKEGHTKSSAELMVTDRRIVAFSQSKIELDIEEIPLNSVNTIGFHKGSASFFAKLFGVLEIIIGIPFSILIVGIKWIKDGIRRIKSGEFTLEITTKGTTDPGFYVGLRRGKARKAAKKIKVWIDKAVITEIGEQLGALVIANR